MGFNPELRPKNLKPLRQSPPSTGYDIESIESWDEAEQLLKEGKITKLEWEDFVDLAMGRTTD